MFNALKNFHVEKISKSFDHSLRQSYIKLENPIKIYRRQN